MTLVAMSASARRRRAHRGHQPAPVGGSEGVSIHCQCGWSTGRYLTAWAAWTAFIVHEADLDRRAS